MFLKLIHCGIIWYLYVDHNFLFTLYSSRNMCFLLEYGSRELTRIVKYKSRVVKSNPEFPFLFETLIYLKLGHNLDSKTYIFSFKIRTFESWSQAVFPSFALFTEISKIVIFGMLFQLDFSIYERDRKLMKEVDNSDFWILAQAIFPIFPIY